ncbi:hypothetical protein DFH06DRAFT_1195099 [Mycena polygramma]|nr:hypothetical protein DFH06DRAFT_1195099 [Mycena polygramma]
MTTPLSAPLQHCAPAFARRRMAQIDLEISTFEISINKLKLEQAILRDRLSNYIYPVLTLPNEIVSEIFLQTLDPSDNPFHLFNSLICGPASPLFLGHICQRWRDIALSTPSLWTTISLRTDIPNPYRQLWLLGIWLTRSRQCSLSVTIADNSRQSNTASLVRRFVDAIAPHHMRLEVLMLKLAYDELPKFRTELPLLRVLHILPVYGFDHSPPPDRVSPLFLAAPKLATVPLHSIRLAIFPLPWAQLTSLSILTHGCLESVAQILRVTRNLTDLTADLRFDYLPASAEIDLPPIPPLMHLRTLVLLLAPFVNVTITTPLQRQLLDILTLPALHRLDVTAPLVSTVADLITRSGCSLQELHTVHIANNNYMPLLSPKGKVELLRVRAEDDESNEEDVGNPDKDDEGSHGSCCSCG